MRMQRLADQDVNQGLFSEISKINQYEARTFVFVK